MRIQSASAGAQLILNRATDCLSSSAVLDSSRTICAVERVPSPVCSVTAKMCWMLAATTLADCASLERLRRDLPDQLGQLARHAVDLAERRARGVGQPGALDHALRAALHRADRVLRVGLDGLDQRGDLPRRVGRALGQPLHLLGHHREAAPRLAGRRGLDRGVQRQHVGLLGDVGDQLGDLADLLRRLAQALDALGGLLDLVADRVHAADRVLHRRAGPTRPRVSDWRATCGRLLRLRRHVVDAPGHLQHRLAGVADLAQLLARRGQQLGRGRLDLLRRVGHAARPCPAPATPALRSSSTV